MKRNRQGNATQGGEVRGEARLSIAVKTRPNGYELEVDGEGYMYFGAESLLEGMCIHVGLERLRAMTREETHAMVEAAKDGSIVKRLQAEVTEQRAEIGRLKRLVRDLKKQMKELGGEIES